MIEHLCRNGVVDPGLLYDSPFIDRIPEGPDGIFGKAEIECFFEKIRTLNRSAMSEVGAEAG